MSEDRTRMTTDAGRPVGDDQDSLTVGPRGPVVFEDMLLFEKMAHFNRERIPERVVHAKGSGAHGYFICTNPDLPAYTTAKLFSAVGKRTPTFLRLSTVGGEKGPADIERDPRGFALKFYTEEGNWDMVGNNTPVFFIRDGLTFGDLVSDYYTPPGSLFRLLPPDARERLIGNIVASMTTVPRRIQERQIHHFSKADPAYGAGVARGLGLGG